MTDVAPAPAPAQTRIQMSLVRMAEAWRRSSDARKGARFVQYLKNFLLAFPNPHTSRSYRFAIEELWDWFDVTYGRMPTPDRIERQDALRYAEWLRTRSSADLAEHRLRRDPDRKLEAAIYEAVRQRPGIRISEIRRQLLGRRELVGPHDKLLVEESDPAGLDRLLACMVKARLLTRTPTVAELRQHDPTLMLKGRLRERIEPEIFQYERAVHTTARGAERASTMTSRLASLASLWNYFITQTGENTGGGEPLLTQNIWTAPLAAAAEIAPSHHEAARAHKTPELPLFEKLLATTYVTQGGSLVSSTTFEDVRDRALLLFLLWTGVRADELGSLRRADVVGTPPLVTVAGKGGKRRVFAVPPPAADALAALTDKLTELAAAAERHEPSEMPRQTRLLQDDAPLFPAVKRWGCNADTERARSEQGLGRSALAMMLRRRAVQAGIAPGSPDFARIHPHGIRHLAGKTAADSGIGPHVIRGVLGHASLSTTGRYVEERDPHTLSLQQRPPPAAGPAPVPVPTLPAAPSRVRQVIETTAVELPAEPPPRPPGAPLAPPPLPPPAERLVAIGRQTPPARPLPAEIELRGVREIEEEVVAIAELDKLYTASRWGERGHREPLHPERISLGGLPAEEDLLTHAYIGTRTGLVWWAGPAGKLKPELPSLASPQLVEGPGLFGSVRQGLEALWRRWMDDAETDASGQHVERGPTAAAALVAWLREALALMEQVDLERKRRGATWVTYDAPLEVTEGTEVTGQAFRMHREDMIVLWFRLRAYTHMAARGRAGGARGARIGRVVDEAGPEGRPVDRRLSSMAWYDSPDPVAELPPGERADLFDWLYALSGRPPPSRTPRFPRRPGGSPALSRWDLAGLVGLFCAYDEARDALGDVRRLAKQGKARDQDIRRAERALDEAGELVRAKVMQLSAGQTALDMKTLVAERVRRTRQRAGLAEEEEDRRRVYRVDFYLQLLGDLFGPDALEDEYLRLFALCREAALGGSLPVAGGYADLFRMDPSGQTIQHTADFARRFALEAGAHSECVARRLARHLWELKRVGAAKRLTDRSQELTDQLDTWAFYKVPCPAPLEAELKRRLGSAEPLALRSAWQAEESAAAAPRAETMTRAERRAARRRLEELGERAEETRSVFEPDLDEEFRQNYLKNARRLLPSPVTLLTWLCL